jgi:hypothetical protein
MAWADLNLDLAMRRVLRESYKDEIPDVIRHRDFALAWPDIKAELEKSLADGTYHPRAPEIVETPKSELATRPLAVLDLADRIVYQAILDQLSPLVDAETTEEVYSARILTSAKGKVFFEPPREAWVRFQKTGRELCDRYDNVCMLTTDITSYFEFIDLELLCQELRRLPGADGALVDLLQRVLCGLRDGSGLNGIPQGPEVSSFLGNFYLRPLDAILRKLDVRFLRYQDDIKVFAEEAYILRKAVLQLTPVVRGRRLNLSSAKTKILEGEEVRQHFEDARKDALQYRVRIEDDTVVGDLRALFDEAVTGKVNERDLKFSLYRLGKFEDAYAVPWVLDHLAEVPYLSELLVRYLSLHSASHPEIEERVCDFLRDETRNLSAYVEMQFIRMFANFEAVGDDTYRLLWDVLLNPAKNTRSRQFAARAIGRHLPAKDTADVPVLEGLLRQHLDDRPLRRALLIALHEAGGLDKQTLGAVAKGSPELRGLCEYLKAGPTLPPP